MKSDDEWISVTLDKAWLKRLKYSESKERFQKNPTIRIRAVKQKYNYVDENGKHNTAELVYFTNLPEKEFSKKDIIRLYAYRWQEVSYKTLKTDCEWE